MIANFTLVWLHVRVVAHVRVQRVLCFKFSAAEITLETFASVPTHVVLERGTRAEAAVAECALEWTLSGVRSLVHFEMTLLAEGKIAEVAFERPIASVLFHMSLQRVLETKTSTTVVAQELAFAVVGQANVFEEIRAVLVAGVAHVARVHLHVGMRDHVT